jgi:hypothetical protein
LIHVRPCELVDPDRECLKGMAMFTFDMMCISAAMDKTEGAGADDTLEEEINRIYARYPDKIRELEKAYA